MGMFQGSFRRRLTVRVRSSVFAVGWRVYVVCTGDRRARVALTDDTGADTVTGLADGTEVEILAWRPRASGTRYRVRAMRGGCEGWLAAGSLRGGRSAISSAPSGPVPPVAKSARPRTRQAAPSTRARLSGVRS